MGSRLNRGHTEGLPQISAAAAAAGIRVPRSKQEGKEGKEPGKPRTGAKANKEAMEEIKRRLDQCVLREEIE